VAGALALVAAALGAGWWRARRESRRLRGRLEKAAGDLEGLQTAFSRFAPDEVIERVLHEGMSGIGEKKEVTVLFADLVGFTALSESLDPPVLVRVLNGYFERMSHAISEHDGRVSTFIGDGILAFFGALTPNPWQGDDAVRAALAMQDAIAAYGRQLAAEGLPPLALGIGLHRGIGVAGLVGSPDLKEFTVVGRTVNVAARVQDLTRRHPAPIIVTGSLAATLDPRFRLRELPRAELKGLSEPVAIYALDGIADEPAAARSATGTPPHGPAPPE
jgi:adenylate cyclase